MKIIDMFRGNKGIPWENRKSIFEHIDENLLEDGCLDSNAVNLPDEDVRYKDNDIRWVAGGMDGAFGHHESSNESNVELAKLTQKIAMHGRTNDKIKFYNIVMKDNIIAMIDNVLEEIIRMQVNITQNLMGWIEFLVFKSPDRGAVKVGIALIGAMGAENYKDRLKIIARHEEFTLYVSVALLNMSENAEQELWELAKHVHGWGRIELVERLSKTERNDIKRWILTEGYKNNIMYEYLAGIAAKTGNLKGELSKAVVEDCILSAAADIIQSLIVEGPAVGISDYEDAYETIEMYIKHTIEKRDDISHLLAYEYIYDYVTDDEVEWEEHCKNGWTEERRKRIEGILKG